MRLNIPRFNGNILATIIIFIGSVVLDASIREYIAYRAKKRLKKGVKRVNRVTGRQETPLDPAQEQKSKESIVI